MVKKFAVKNHRDIALLIAHGLLAVCQADNAQPPGNHGYARPDEEPFLIRAAVDDRTRHPLDDFFRHISPSDQIYHASYATHYF
jgi:hypothetical protein